MRTNRIGGAIAGALLATILATGLAIAPAGAGEGSGQWSGLKDWKGLVAIHSVVAPDGGVMVWDREKGLTSARRWDPATEQFTSVPGVDAALFCAFQTTLPDGRLAVVGGTAATSGGTGIERLQIFDWATNTWTTGAPMHTPRWYPTVVALGDGRLVALGGQVRKGLLANLPEVYDPAANRWTELPALALSNPLGNYPNAALAPNGKLFLPRIPGGQSAYLDVDAQTWTPVTQAPPSAVRGTLVTIDRGVLLLIASGSTRTDAWRIDLNAPQPAWRQVASLASPRSKFATVVLADGTVAVIGGSTDGSSATERAVMTPELFDPATETWRPLPDLAVPRMYHSTAVLLPDGRVLSAGGGRSGSAINYPSAQLYAPAYAAVADRPAVTAVDSTIWSTGSSASVTVSSGHGIHRLALLGLGATTHSRDTQQRYVPLPVASGPDADGTVTVAVPSASLTPAGHYLLVAIDGRGVPSTGRIVRITTTPATPPAPGTAPDAGTPRTVEGPSQIN